MNMTLSIIKPDAVKKFDCEINTMIEKNKDENCGAKNDFHL